MSVGLFTWSGWLWDHEFARLLPLLERLATAREAVAEGSLQVEAHLRREETVAETQVAETFARATAALDDRVFAGRPDGTPDTFLAPGGAFTVRLRAYREAIAQTAAMAQERVRWHTPGPAADQLDLRLFTALHGLGLMADALDSTVHAEWRRILATQRRLRGWTLGVWLALLSGISVALLLEGRRRARAEAALAVAHTLLEQKVEERTVALARANQLLRTEVEERRQAEHALSRSEADLRALSYQLLTVQEDERSRIARELHDGISQDLSAIKFRVEHAGSQLRGGDAAGASGSCETAVCLLQDALDDMRRTYMALRPSLLDDLGLLAAVQWFCREFQASHPGIRIDLELSVEEAAVPEGLKVTVFRILQEALNNVGQHSAASRARVVLAGGPEGLELAVEDDGRGFPDPDRGGEPGSTGVGLRSMRERARSTGGELVTESRPGRGAGVRVVWAAATAAGEPA
jgi:signal transduction histidine kinase